MAKAAAPDLLAALVEPFDEMVERDVAMGSCFWYGFSMTFGRTGSYL